MLALLSSTSIWPVSFKFSCWSFLNMCPRNFSSARIFIMLCLLPDTYLLSIKLIKCVLIHCYTRILTRITIYLFALCIYLFSHVCMNIYVINLTSCCLGRKMAENHTTVTERRKCSDVISSCASKMSSHR